MPHLQAIIIHEVLVTEGEQNTQRWLLTAFLLSMEASISAWNLEQHTQRPTCKPHLSLSHHMNLSTCSLCHLQSQGSRQQQPCAGPQQHSHAALHIQSSRAWHCKVSLHRWCDHCGHCALSSTLLSCVGTAHCVWDQPQGAGSSWPGRPLTTPVVNARCHPLSPCLSLHACRPTAA